MSQQNDALVAAINAWQQAGDVHPLTCGVDSTHRDLVPYIDPDARVCLKCLDCRYRQVVTGTTLERILELGPPRNPLSPSNNQRET